jgi:methionyl-tRNA formyltransferase
MRILFMGTGEFAEPTFEALLAGRHEVVGLVTNPDRPSGREREMLRHIKQLAVARGVPVFQPESVNTPEGVAGVQAFRPELLVVAAYGQILSNEVLKVAPRGGINVHASLLPKYRGAAPINWAIYHGETQTGVTIIRMSTKLDAGDMLAQEAVDILPDETAGELEARLAPLGAKLALQVIEQIAAGTTSGVKQDPALVTKAPKLKKEHGLIDWSRTAAQVCNQIRAMQPWPTAYTYWHRTDGDSVRLILKKVRVERWITVTESGSALVIEEPQTPGPPGMVVEIVQGQAGMPDRLVVRTCRHDVAIEWLQPAGKRVMTISEFLRGHRVRAGELFGPAGDASVAVK